MAGFSNKMAVFSKSHRNCIVNSFKRSTITAAKAFDRLLRDLREEE
jgi:hypothetical protein